MRAASLKNPAGAQAKTAGQNTVMLVRYHFIIGGIFLCIISTMLLYMTTTASESLAGLSLADLLGGRFSARVHFSVRAPSSEDFWAALLPERFSALGDIRIRRILTILISDR
ncbi:ABC transporter permease [Bacillus licheniformis]